VWAARSKFVVRGGDLVGVSVGWLEGTATAGMFAALPRVRDA